MYQMHSKLKLFILTTSQFVSFRVINLTKNTILLLRNISVEEPSFVIVCVNDVHVLHKIFS